MHVYIIQPKTAVIRMKIKNLTQNIRGEHPLKPPPARQASLLCRGRRRAALPIVVAEFFLLQRGANLKQPQTGLELAGTRSRTLAYTRSRTIRPNVRIWLQGRG